jgi:hypothetical protein
MDLIFPLDQASIKPSEAHIELRDAPRDSWKLAHWDEYTSTLNTDTSPTSAHLTIDNRLGAAISLAEQTRHTLRKILA